MFAPCPWCVGLVCFSSSNKQGAGLRLQRGGLQAQRSGWLRGRENRRSLRSCVVVEDALNAMRIIDNIYIIIL